MAVLLISLAFVCCGLILLSAAANSHGTAWKRWRLRGWRNRLLRPLHRRRRVLCDPLIPPAEGVPSADIVAAVRRRGGA